MNKTHFLIHLFFFFQLMNLIIGYNMRDSLCKLWEKKEYALLSKFALFMSMPTFVIISLILNPY